MILSLAGGAEYPSTGRGAHWRGDDKAGGRAGHCHGLVGSRPLVASQKHLATQHQVPLPPHHSVPSTAV